MIVVAHEVVSGVGNGNDSGGSGKGQMSSLVDSKIPSSEECQCAHEQQHTL